MEENTASAEPTHELWSEEKVLQLIEAYRTRDILWNPQNESFYKKHLKLDAWLEIANLMETTQEKCNNKIISLLSSYRREKLREKKSKGTGKGASERYTSRWFAYEALKFLDDRNKPRKRMNSFWSAFVPCGAQDRDAVQLTLEQIDVIKRLVDKYPQYLKMATSVTDILEAHSARPRKIASLIGIEGGHSIGNSLGILRTYYHLGVRYMTLTHTCNTPWADSSNEPAVANGLTDFGEKVVKEMNRLGMVVDLSHVGENTTRAAIRVSRAPVVFSHSSVYSLCNHKRNVPDDIIQSLKENGGIIMVNFFPDFVKCSPNATISDVAEHFHYIKRLVGAEYVGIGGDFDGVNRVARGLEDVSKYPTLFAELLRSGQWSVQELKNLAGLNMLRVMRQVEKVRDEMRTNGSTPQEHTDSPTDNGNCTSNAFYQEIS